MYQYIPFFHGAIQFSVTVILLIIVVTVRSQQRSEHILSCVCFSSVLVAACEENDLLMFDPHNGKLTGSRNAAHTDSVNCVRCVNTSLLLSLDLINHSCSYVVSLLLCLRPHRAETISNAFV